MIASSGIKTCWLRVRITETLAGRLRDEAERRGLKSTDIVKHILSASLPSESPAPQLSQPGAEGCKSGPGTN